VQLQVHIVCLSLCAIFTQRDDVDDHDD
jgi:hypothetical protein